VSDYVTPSDRDYAIRTMLGEAANQGDEGLAAVAHVIMNRTRGGYGSTPREVVLARGQFEPWATRRDELLGYAPEDPAYQRAAAIFDKVVAGGEDPTGGATHFLNEKIVRQRRGGSLPGWAQGEGTRIGDHTFYRVAENRKMDTSLFDKYDSAAEPKASASAASTLPAPGASLFDKYDLPAQAMEEKPAPRGDATRGGYGRVGHGVPVLGPIVEKAAAATGAAIQGATGRDVEGRPLPPGSTFDQRYQNNLETVERDVAAADEKNPFYAAASDMAGTGMLLGPVAGTRWGASALGMTGNSLGIKALKGASSMTALEVANQYLQGKDPRQQGFFGPVPVAMVTGAAGPLVQHGVDQGVNKLIQMRAPKQGTLAGTNSVTRNKLMEAFEGETPASIAESAVGHGRAGLTMDMNQATRDIAGGLADIPGPAKAEIRETLRQRSAGQAGRLRETLDRNTVPHADVAQLATDIDEARRVAAAPLYEQFRSTRVPPTKEIKENIIPRLEAAGAFNSAEELAGITGRPWTQNFFTGGPQKEFPTAEAWDLAKRGLDRRIAAAYDKGDNTLGKALVELKHDMIREVEKAPGGQVWRQARETFAEHSALLDQLEAGQKTWQRTMRADELAQELKTLNPNELAARRQGARDAINEIMTNTVNGDTTARNRLLTEAGREKLRLLFGDARAERLIKDLEAEVRVSRNTNEIVGGSPTASKQARRNALLPEQTEPGYLSNINLTRPTSLWPEWATPRAIMEGERHARHARSHEELGRVMQIPMRSPEFRDLLRAISTEGQRRAAGSAYAGRLSSSAAPTVQSIAATQRNRLTEPLNSEPKLEGSSR
jgi:hypothetical protein